MTVVLFGAHPGVEVTADSLCLMMLRNQTSRKMVVSGLCVWGRERGRVNTSYVVTLQCVCAGVLVCAWNDK